MRAIETILQNKNICFMTSNAVIAAGIDIGATTAKAVMLNGNKMIASCVVPTEESIAGSAESVMQQTLANLNLSISDIEHIVATGYERRAVPFAHKVITEISCHAGGVHRGHARILYA